MNRMLTALLIPLALGLLPALQAARETVVPPAPYGPVPEARQLNWQSLHVYAFIHFSVNTFTGNQWGGGDEAPSVFNPTGFDADQIARTVREAGMAGLILTCKHHDGFCLWPSAYTGHSVKNSPWRGGKGDVVKELSEACRRQGILFGAYLSPWDRNHAEYGHPKYLEYYRNQIRELLTKYGPVFEMWFDGANGGSGYYGGKMGRRNIDASTYYDWPRTFSLIRELQPGTIIWTPDTQGDVQWGGSESGTVKDPCWATDGTGLHDGKKWIPKEADVSIRRDWFYNPNPSQIASIKTPSQLMDIYFKSVGRGANLILNLPPDRRGVIPEPDVEALRAWHAVMQETFGTDLARDAVITASNVRGNAAGFGPENMIEGRKKSPDSYWATDDAEKTPSFTVDLGKPILFNVIELREYLPLGQRVGRVAFDKWDGSAWVEITQVPSVGSQRLVRLPDTTASKVRVRVLEAAACPAFSRFGLYRMPALPSDPQIRRDRSGMVSVTPKSATGQFHYTLDGKDPTASSPLYNGPFALPNGGMVKVRSILEGGRQSPVAAKTFGLSKGKWKVVSGSFPEGADKVIDDDPKTDWYTVEKNGDVRTVHPAPHFLEVDLGETSTVSGFTYLPNPRRTGAAVDQYRFSLSMDGKDWGKPVAEGEFANIKASPIEQTVLFPKQQARYFRFEPLHAVQPDEGVSVSELGLIGE